MHGAVWKKSEKPTRAAEMKARLMIDRALAGQPCNTPGVCHLLAVGLSSNMTDQVVLKMSKSNV